MDCDNEIRLVKRDNDPHTHSLDLSGVAEIPLPISIHEHGMGDYSFCVGNAEAMSTSPVLGMSREAHAHSRARMRNLSPFWTR